MSGKPTMKPYSERFIRRLNNLLERVILNNRELTVLQIKNVGNEMALGSLSMNFYIEYKRQLKHNKQVLVENKNGRLSSQSKLLR